MRGAEQKEMTSDNPYYLLLAFEVITARESLLFLVRNSFSRKQQFISNSTKILPKVLNKISRIILFILQNLIFHNVLCFILCQNVMAYKFYCLIVA